VNRVSYTFFVILFFSCSHPESSTYERFKGERSSAIITTDEDDEKTEGFKVVGVKDGDTFVLLMNGKEQVIRLAHIDCPEKNQPFGTKAKYFASDIAFGKYVTLVHNERFDSYKRLIAEVILEDGQNMNKLLVENGLAWHFKKFSDDNVYEVLEAEARRNGLGIWSEKNPTAPWDWRKD
jgi:micrococcal nuclease